MNKYKTSLRPIPKYSDPRICQIDLDLPVVDTSHIFTIHKSSNRVMPLKNDKKFFSLLRRSTQTFKGADVSHFWVSGYIALHFGLKSKADRSRIKKIVMQAVKDSGGCMNLEEWLIEHKKPEHGIFVFAGTGSSIQGGQINGRYQYR